MNTKDLRLKLLAGAALAFAGIAFQPAMMAVAQDEEVAEDTADEEDAFMDEEGDFEDDGMGDDLKMSFLKTMPRSIVGRNGR